MDSGSELYLCISQPITLLSGCWWSILVCVCVAWRNERPICASSKRRTGSLLKARRHSSLSSCHRTLKCCVASVLLGLSSLLFSVVVFFSVTSRGAFPFNQGQTLPRTTNNVTATLNSLFIGVFFTVRLPLVYIYPVIQWRRAGSGWQRVGVPAELTTQLAPCLTHTHTHTVIYSIKAPNNSYWPASFEFNAVWTLPPWAADVTAEVQSQSAAI